MAKNSPVAIWMIKHSPSREPKFQSTEMFAGVGRSTNAPLAILNSGWFFRRGIDIAYLMRGVRVPLKMTSTLR